MQIDPLKLLTGYAGPASQPAPKAAGDSFETLLEAAQSGSISALELAEQAQQLVHLARFQMLQGLFDFAASDSGGSALIPLPERATQLELPDQISQKLDSLHRSQSAARYSLLKPAQSSRGEIDAMIERVAKHVSLAPELIRSVVSVESDFAPDAMSRAGAQGLMQLMPETARELGVEDSFDPMQNLLGGSLYLKRMLDRYDGDLDHALAAYNWGPGNVDRHGLAKLPQETRDYIARVKGRLG